MNLKRMTTRDVEWQLLDEGTCRAGRVPLLFVHGFPLDHSMWRQQVVFFSQHTRVICPDLPGFGASRWIKGPGEFNLDSVAKQLGSLLTGLGIETAVDFCGLSMGGYIGWQFWKHQDRQLNRIVACDTRAVADSEEVARGRRMMARTIEGIGTRSLVEGDFLQRLFGVDTREANSRLVEHTKTVVLNTDPQAIAAAQLGMSIRPDVTDWLPEMDLPALVVAGEEDSISVPDEMRQIALKMPNAQFEIISHAGHMAPAEQPEQFNQILYEFISRGEIND